MVTQDDLEGLDHFLWHGSGPRAATELRCNQSTISRRVQRCLGTFGLRLKRRQGEWRVCGSPLLLQMEREIHQLARLLGRSPLRLEGFPVGADLLLKPPPPGWALGPQDAVGVMGPLTLLRERVIDAWLTDAAEDLPTNGDFPFVVWSLASQPIHLLADADHPLAGDAGVSYSDLFRFPMPILSPQGYPRSHAICDRLGLGSVETAIRRYDPDCWEGQTADGVTLVYTTPLNMNFFPNLVAIDTEPLFFNRLALVLREDISEHGPVQDLHCMLKSRLQHLQSHYAALERLKLLP